MEVLLACARHLKCLNLFFADEITIQLTPTLTRTWGLRGKQARIMAWPGNHRKTHIFGAMDPIHGRVYRHLAPTINADHFRKLLRLLLRRHPRGTVIVVLDNAVWHKSRSSIPFLARHKRLQLFFLPKYSPDMNPIEPLWKLLRRDVTHNHFFGDLPAQKAALGNALDAMNRRPESIISLANQYVKVQ